MGKTLWKTRDKIKITKFSHPGFPQLKINLHLGVFEQSYFLTSLFNRLLKILPKIQPVENFFLFEKQDFLSKTKSGKGNYKKAAFENPSTLSRLFQRIKKGILEDFFGTGAG